MGYYEPNLDTALILIKQHILYKGNYFHAEDNECIIAFPDTITSCTTNDEIMLPLIPASHTNIPYAFDKDTATRSRE